MPERKRLDSQQVELIGRSKLEARLIQHGFEVARPHRDRGIDLIAYRDREAGHFAAVPIQMKASSGTRFGAWRKFGNTDDLIVVYIWHVLSDQPRFFVLTAREAIALIPKSSKHGGWSWPKAPARLVQELERKHENRWEKIR